MYWMQLQKQMVESAPFSTPSSRLNHSNQRAAKKKFPNEEMHGSSKAPEKFKLAMRKLGMEIASPPPGTATA